MDMQREFTADPPWNHIVDAYDLAQSRTFRRERTYALAPGEVEPRLAPESVLGWPR